MIEPTKKYNIIEDGEMSPYNQAMTYFRVLTRGGVGATFFCHRDEYYGQYCTRDEEAFKQEYHKYWETQNCYMPLNLFSGEYRYNEGKHKWGFFREEYDVRYVNGLLLDFDIMKGEKEKKKYTIEVGDKLVDEVVEKVKELVEEGKMVTPTLVTKSGRGVQMLVLYEEPISVSDEIALFKHKRLYAAVTSFLQSLFDKKYVEVDTSVKDASRICRLPGTKHLKNDRMATLQEVNPNYYYNLEELCEVFEVDLTPEEKKKPGRKPSKNKEGKEKKKRKVYSTLAVRYALNETIVPFMNLQQRRNIRSLINVLETLAKNRGMEEGQYREVLIFLYYNLQRQLDTAFCARRLTERFNETFDEPLSNAEFWTCIEGVDTHRGFKGTYLQAMFTSDKNKYPNGYYKFTRDTVVEKLSMSEEEIEATGIFKRRREKERAKVNNSKKKECMSLIICMLKNGESEPAIVSEVMKKSGKSRATAYRWIAKAKEEGCNSSEKCEESKEEKMEENTEKNRDNQNLSHFGVNQGKRENREETKGAISAFYQEEYERELMKEEYNTGELVVEETQLKSILCPDGRRVETVVYERYYNDRRYWIDKESEVKSIKTFYDAEGNVTKIIDKGWKKSLTWQLREMSG